MAVNSYIIDFSELYKFDLDLVSKKAYQLGELKHLGIPIPDGFVITSLFFNDFLQKTGILEEIENIKNSTHPALYGSLPKLLEPIQKKIMQTHIPENLSAELHSFYKKLAGAFKEPSLNIYSSTKDNQSIVFYDVKGDANLILKIKDILSYYLDQPFSIVIQKNIKAKDKRTMVTNEVNINDQNILKLAKKIQKYFYFPQELNFVVHKSKIYVTQVKPFTSASVIDESQKKIQKTWKLRKILVQGISLNPGIVTGVVKLINNQNFDIAKNSEIIVAKSLNKSSYSKIKRAKAIIIDDDLSSSYDRMLYRKDIKIPTIIKTRNAAKILQNGNVVTVNGMSGEIYRGSLI